MANEPWERMVTEEQRRTLNAACGDLAKHVRWHGFKLDKDDFRHFLAGTVKGFRMVPGWDNGDGKRGFVMLGASSLTLTKSECMDAITMAFSLGDDPSSQGLDIEPIKWSRTVMIARGWSPAMIDEMEAGA